jgi:hypothetical protein
VLENNGEDMTHDDHIKQLSSAMAFFAETLPGKYADDIAQSLIALKERNPLRLVRAAQGRYIPICNVNQMIATLCNLEVQDVVRNEQHSYYLNVLLRIKSSGCPKLLRTHAGWSVPDDTIKPINLTQTTTVGKPKPMFKARRRND